MKKLLSTILALLILITLFTPAALANQEITILINGEKLVTDVPAQTMSVYDNGAYVGDRVLVPLRAISEKLNCDVHWSENTGGITLYRKDNLYVLWVGQQTAFHLDGLALSKTYKMDVPPYISESRTLVPVRAVSELLGAKVDWISETRTVDIKYDLGEIENNAGLAEKCEVFQALLYQGYSVYEAYADGTLEGITGKIVLESGEEITFKVYPQIAPQTCENFVNLAKNKFYNNTIFHRVINDFVAQGGGYTANNEYKNSNPIEGEFIYNGIFNLMPHKRGTISMARTDDPNSASSQFFIVQKEASHLNGSYAGFGEVIEGMDVVDKICSSETNENDAPLTPIVIKEVIINE